MIPVKTGKYVLCIMYSNTKYYLDSIAKANLHLRSLERLFLTKQKQNKQLLRIKLPQFVTYRQPNAYLNYT